ncbi:lamin tail domain-containing protein [Streptomyces rishiriensis]|uniref:lamin tail domain-containing protein n=1 Tax=Streptomyces rishiriensis TaxID=68264 RepID=UPI0037D1EB1F
MSVNAVSARCLAAAAIAAAVVGTVALPASAADHPHQDRAKVEISAVQYDAPGRNDRSARSLNREWVELTNTTRHEVNLDGWTLSDERGETYTFRHYRLAPRTTVRVHTGEGRDTRTDLFQDRHREVWDNYSDTATLRNDHGRFVDDESWGHDRHGHGRDDHGRDDHGRDDHGRDDHGRDDHGRDDHGRDDRGHDGHGRDGHRRA